MSQHGRSRELITSGSLRLEEWRRVGPLIDAVLDAEPERRGPLIHELTSGDPALRAQLEALVAECEREYPLLERPAGERFTTLFGDDEPPVPALLTERYQILRELGRGGMAIVYVARDLRHNREVAVKVVRPELAAALGRARFLREIEIAARLRHPHIVPLYDSGESDGVLYYVMPYEAGHSLRERLARDGPLPVEDVVLILRGVCDALTHAHQHGIVHRDIKPDNVLLSERHAMVADFGVARAVNAASAGPDGEAAAAATIGAATGGTTAASGLALGTPAYMAPEQVTAGSEVDHRADIYAVGVLGFELLAGRPPFTGADRERLLAAHAQEPPADVRTHRPDVPKPLAALIMRCLEKVPDDRWQSAQELRSQLEPIVSVDRVPAAAAPSRGAALRPVAAGLAVAALVVVVVTLALVADDARSGGTGRVIAFGPAHPLTSDPGLEVQPSISPDGRQLAFAAGHSLQMRIFVRPVDGGRPVRLTDGTENEWFPRWSPDGTRILFLSQGGVFSAPAGGGPAVAEVAGRPGAIVTSATWSPDGREIAYVRGDSLLARAVDGGDVRLITTGGELHSCSWAPDGAQLACVAGNDYYVTVGTIYGLGPMFGNLAPSRIVLVPATGGERVTVTDSSSLHQSPAWSSDGRTLYYVSNRQGPRDVYALDVSGRVAARAEPVRITTGLGAHSIDFSWGDGHVAYAVYRSTANAWAVDIPTDPPGSLEGAVAVTSGNQTVEGLRISPDGRFLVYDSDLRGNSDVYRIALAGGEPERLTSGPLDEFRGVISPDGKELTYHSFQTGSRDMFMMPVAGGSVQQITRSTGHLSMANWSPEGTALTLFDMVTSHVYVMHRDSDGRWGLPRYVARDGWRPEWSPDGRTIAFVSPTDGRIGIVSADSGAQRDLYVPAAGDPLAELAVFSADGRELYFKSHDALGRASFWSIPAAGGQPRLLLRFDDPARPSNRFEFASDGRRFYYTAEDRQSDIWLAEIEWR